MKKNYFITKINQIILYAAIGAAAFFCLFFSDTIASGINRGIGLCMNNMIPALFPFLIFSTFVGRLNICPSENNFFCKMMNLLFGLSHNSIPTLLVSMIGGYPVGLKQTALLYRSNRISHTEKEVLTAICFHSAPSFVITAVGLNIFSSSEAGIIIYLSLIFGSFFTALIASHKHKMIENAVPKQSRQNANKINMTEALIDSVSDSVKSMCMICVWICIFCGISDTVSHHLGELPYYLSVFCEVTDGCILCAEKQNLPLAAAVCAFGGLCVHLQILPDLRKMQIKYRHFFKYRLIHSILSYFICYILMQIRHTATVSALQKPQVALQADILQLLFLLLLCIAFVFDTSRNNKNKSIKNSF